MKKVALILLICVYSLATTGVTLQQFYCCGKLKSITLSFTADTKEDCAKGGGAGCCDNKYQFFKVKEKHVSAAQISNPIYHFTDLHFYNHFFSIIPFAVQQTDVAYSSHAPPLHIGVPRYIYNCVFRI